MKKNQGFTVVELLITIAIFMIVASILGPGCSTGGGDRVGTVIKLSQVGFYYKTWEGQMLLGGQGAVNQGTWSFSVTDGQVLGQIKDALNGQYKVKLTYQKIRLLRPSQGSTTYFITGVARIDDQSNGVASQ